MASIATFSWPKAMYFQPLRRSLSISDISKYHFYFLSLALQSFSISCSFLHVLPGIQCWIERDCFCFLFALICLLGSPPNNMLFHILTRLFMLFNPMEASLAVMDTFSHFLSIFSFPKHVSLLVPVIQSFDSLFSPPVKRLPFLRASNSFVMKVLSHSLWPFQQSGLTSEITEFLPSSSPDTFR